MTFLIFRYFQYGDYPRLNNVRPRSGVPGKLKTFSGCIMASLFSFKIGNIRARGGVSRVTITTFSLHLKEH